MNLRRLISEMKGCKRIKRDIVAYLNGELGMRRRSRIEQHLKRCPECQREYSSEKRMEKLLFAEMQRIGREYDPLLPWSNLRPHIEREAAVEDKRSRWTGISENWWAPFKEACLPKAAQALSKVLYCGKRASIPVACMILAFILYNTFQPPTYAPAPELETAPAHEHMIVRVNFGPNGAEIKGYYADGGKAYSLAILQHTKKEYGWRED